MIVVLKNTVDWITRSIFVLFRKLVLSMASRCLSTEAVQGAALSLEGMHHIQSSHGLATSMLSVGHRIADDILKEDLKDTSGLLVDEARDALHTTSACQAADCGLGNALDVVSQDLPVALSATLAESLATFSSARHDR